MRARIARDQGDRGETLIQPVSGHRRSRLDRSRRYRVLCVKLWDVESAGEQIKPLIGPDTGVIPTQNGIDASDRLLPILGAAHVMAGTVADQRHDRQPGVIRQTGTFMSLAFGERDGSLTQRHRASRHAVRKAGFEVTAERDHRRADLAEIHPADRHERRPRSPACRSANCAMIPTFWRWSKTRCAETEAVGTRRRGARSRTNGRNPDRDGRSRHQPPGRWPRWRSICDSGNRLELPWLAGKVVVLGRKHGIPTPTNGAPFSPR